VTIPAGTRITCPGGNPVSQITITPVPIDRSPMPFPPGVTAPMLFTIQPGGAVPSQPLPITFPNVQNAAPPRCHSRPTQYAGRRLRFMTARIRMLSGLTV